MTRSGGDKPIVHAARVANVAGVDVGAGDAAWSRAEPVSWDTDYAGEPTGIVTRARFLHSPRGLHVLWELESTGLNVDRSRPTDVPRPKLYEEDCVELFFAPDPKSPRHYYEMEHGPFGHYWDLDIDLDAQKSDATWSSGAQIVTTRDPARRAARIEATLTAPGILRALAPGTKLPIGLYRMDGRDPRKYLAWSPPRTAKPNFHVPQAFGVLVLDP